MDPELLWFVDSLAGLGWNGESLSECIKRHEHFLALQLGLKPGQKVLDVGCGIGGPLREIARFRYWRLSIPIGETIDHPLVNPFGPNSPGMEAMELDPILAIMGEDDLLRDIVKEYVQKLKGWGKKIEYVEFEGKHHGFFDLDPKLPRG